MATSSDLAEDDEASETLIEVIARAQVTYHRYHVLLWLSQRTGAGEGERENQKWSSRDDVLVAFGSLKMRENEDKGVDSDGYDTAYSLLHALLAHPLAQQVPRDTVACLFDMASSLLADLALVGSEQFDVEPRAADIKLAFTVLADGHADTASELTELYPTSSGTAYVHGLALIEVGDVERGAHLLERASAGCRGELTSLPHELTSDGSLQAINPEWRNKKALGAYFHHVMNVVEQRELWVPVARFGERALQSMDKDASDAKDIWTRIFLAYLQLGQYEDAYATLTNAPLSDKSDLLGQLISAMCEANEIGRLNSLGFIGFQKEVEERLNFKARNSDPCRNPNYYEVLYSWHISRGDYRSAGETMYAQANRYTESGSSKLNHTQAAALRARSFLAAINALSLVDKRNAWIAIQSPRGAKRRRVTSYVPEEAFATSAPPTDIVTLADMRSEYRAILSQLKLASEVPDLLVGNVSLAPAEIVGFFTQRDKFDDALLAAAEMQEDMTDVFTALATRCVELSRGARRDDARAAFLRAPATARLRGPPSALALRYLQIALGRHDGDHTRWKYTSAVADTFFALNEDAARGWAMPAWLVQGELGRDAAGWIARAVRFGWVKEAIEWSADALRAEASPEKKDGSSDTPFNLYDRVLAACKEGEEKEDARTQAAAKALRESVERRVAATRKVAKV
jgi:nuclear pore complex protein Nup160